MLATKRRQPVNKVANSPGREEEEEGVFVRLFSSRIFALPILAVPSFWASPSSSSSSLGPARVALTRLSHDRLHRDKQVPWTTRDPRFSSIIYTTASPLRETEKERRRAIFWISFARVCLCESGLASIMFLIKRNLTSFSCIWISGHPIHLLSKILLVSVNKSLTTIPISFVSKIIIRFFLIPSLHLNIFQQSLLKHCHESRD